MKNILNIHWIKKSKEKKLSENIIYQLILILFFVFWQILILIKFQKSWAQKDIV